ncbi:MAG TPA: biopolymer transporter ExbD [Elusimicrobia bacterium]|nr:biopolymer transporter ExbD [Elusimicrobiota bacterium]HBT61552.1 biopolymer transporter ExbD [Elusimicrobiota bacterium]
MASTSSDETSITGINVTPLVDIILVVLIIFMATAPLIHNRAMKVDLPKAAQHEKAATEALQVMLNAQREVYLSGKLVTREELGRFLKGLSASSADVRVALRADQSVPYGEIVGLLDVIRGAGVRKIGLEVKPK